mgnify:CR=1 FL=1
MKVNTTTLNDQMNMGNYGGNQSSKTVFLIKTTNANNKQSYWKQDELDFL